MDWYGVYVCICLVINTTIQLRSLNESHRVMSRSNFNKHLSDLYIGLFKTCSNSETKKISINWKLSKDSLLKMSNFYENARKRKRPFKEMYPTFEDEVLSKSQSSADIIRHKLRSRKIKGKKNKTRGFATKSSTWASKHVNWYMAESGAIRFPVDDTHSMGKEELDIIMEELFFLPLDNSQIINARVNACTDCIVLELGIENSSPLRSV